MIIYKCAHVTLLKVKKNSSSKKGKRKLAIEKTVQLGLE